ncbi:MAG: aminoacylase, partial [Cellvibrionales bacterium]|nr:aminoacylase [Cellvibrionales bacterium]
VAVKDGRVIARGENLPREIAADVINAEGRWLIPGMLDIHTHLDLEVDLEPGLPEVVRHGTTTVLVGNCSLGTCFGRQESDGQEPIVDCFTRVENIPKSVLRKCSDTLTWDNTADYLDHFKQIPLGPNVAAFVPHSMLRIEAMGLENSISRAPTRAELEKMESLLEEAMGQGYVGMSTDGLPFHYLSNDPNTEKRIPTQFASFGELKRLLSVVRRHDRVWQTTPIIENRLKAFLYFTLTSGRLFGKTLKTSALSAMEMTAAPKLSRTLLKFAKLMNSWLFKGDMHFQALGTNFRVWSDGIVSPLFDASWKTRMGIPDNLVIRDPSLLIFDGAPVSEWDGESFEAVSDRLNRYKAGDLASARTDQERDVFDSFPETHTDEPGFILHLLRRYDRHFRFYADVGNQGNRATLELLLGENTLPGFNDSGAHITNMAFFDANLMSLKLAKQQDEATVAQMVHRLTRKPAEVFGLDV